MATNSLADLPWWEVFHDPALQHLISLSLTNNYDLRIAVTRVEQARALAAQAQAQFMPTVGYQGGISRGRNEFAGNPSPNQATTGDAALATLNAAWEVDLWGRIRRLNEASRAQLLATEAAQHGVQLSLVGAVATAYFQLLQLEAQLQVARRTSNSFQESYDIFNRRRLGGVASKLETSRAEAALATTAASVPELERQIVIKENEISVLAGLPPGPVQRTLGLLDQKLPVEIPPGLPSQLLERRPDIRQAEQLIRAANAQVGVTIAEFFPRIGLTAFLGKVSPELAAVTAGSANAWSVAAGASGPIFQGGALVAQTRQARAAWEESRLRYDQAVLIALQEVANALISREKIEGTVFQQARAVTAYREAVEGRQPALHCRQGLLLRGAGGATGVVPGRKHPRPGTGRPADRRCPALQSPRRRLERTPAAGSDDPLIPLDQACAPAVFRAELPKVATMRLSLFIIIAIGSIIPTLFVIIMRKYVQQDEHYDETR